MRNIFMMKMINFTLISPKKILENWKWKFIGTCGGWHTFNTEFNVTMDMRNLWRLIRKAERLRVKLVSSHYILLWILMPLALHNSSKIATQGGVLGIMCKCVTMTQIQYLLLIVFCATYSSKWLDLNKWIIVSS